MLRIGIVGAGGMGTVHYNNYKHIENCEVVALVGISNQDAARATEWNVPLYPSITEMLEKQEIDVVDICTPTFLHKEQVLASLTHGKHTIVEKPLTLSVAEGKEMLEVAKANHCHLYVAHVLQFTKEVGILRDLVEKQTYGKPLDVYFERLSACPEWAQGGWLFEKDKSGLLAFDLHIHDLDIMISLFGKPNTIDVKASQREEVNYVEHYRILYGYDGLNVVGEAAWFHAEIPFWARWRVCFENAVLVYDGTTLTAYPYHQSPVVYNIEDEVKIPTGINVPPTGWYYNELKHFINCISEGKPTPLVTEEQLIQVLEVLEEIDELTTKK